MIKKIKYGFTLVEMLVTIVLVALCVAVLVWISSSYYKESNLKSISNKIISDMTEITNGEEIYFTKFGRYANATELMESGVLKSFPLPPDNAMDQDCLNNEATTKHYDITAINSIVSNNNNLYVVLPCAKESVAEMINNVMQSKN